MVFETRKTVGLPTNLSGVSTNITPGGGGVAIHYNGGAVGIPATAAHSKCRARARDIHRFHTTGNGWAYGAYSEIVCQHGIRMQMRGAGRRTAANGTNHGNQHFYAVMGLIGGNETPSEAMLDGIAEAVAYYRGLSAKAAGKTVQPHSFFIATSCCGDKLRAQVRAGRFGKVTGGGGGGGGVVVVDALGRGDSGTAVEAWQKDLIAVGIALPKWGADGGFGAETEDATETFQAWRGITVDGLVGPVTRKEMTAAKKAGDRYKAGSKPKPTPSARLAVDGDFGPLSVRATQSATGAKVNGRWDTAAKKALQRHLNAKHKAGLKVDGAVGPLTIKALQRYLNKVGKAGLKVDGAWGPATTRALQKALNASKF